jgi:hypothetical protein
MAAKIFIFKSPFFLHSAKDRVSVRSCDQGARIQVIGAAAGGPPRSLTGAHSDRLHLLERPAGGRFARFARASSSARRQSLPLPA